MRSYLGNAAMEQFDARSHTAASRMYASMDVRPARTHVCASMKRGAAQLISCLMQNRALQEALCDARYETGLSARGCANRDWPCAVALDMKWLRNTRSDSTEVS
jgi:hypothetical protein